MSILDHVEGTMRIVFTVGVVIIAFAALAVFAPIWATPIAKFWYKSGFEGSVTKALAAIPDVEQACIYDDTRNIFVTSLDQLDVDRMIEQAVRDKVPRFRLNMLQRDPHFRVLANGSTYYWSFRDAKFYPFWGHRWTLEGNSARMCEAYKRSPLKIREAFRNRDGIAVTEANFCCSLEEET